MLSHLRQSFSYWQKSRASERELTHLSCRDLDDLGILPGDLYRRQSR